MPALCESLDRRTLVGAVRSSALTSTWVVVGAAIFVFLIFVPVGLSMMGLIEEWDLYFAFKKYGTFYLASASSPLSTHRLRPLTVTPFTIGYVLGPDSFFWLNILQVIALFLKVIGMTAAVNWMTGNRLLAIICGFIFLTYPADTMQMTLRSVHINWAIALSVGGIAIILDSTKRTIRPLRLAEAILASLFFLAGSLIYEAGLFLAPVPLLLWWARFGFQRGWLKLKQNLDVISVFAAAAIGAAAYVFVVSLTGNNYQMEVTGDHIMILKDVMKRLPLLFEIALYRLFFHGWYDGFRMLSLHLDFWPYLLATLALLIALLFLMPAGPTLAQGRPLGSLKSARIATAGVAAAVLGYLPYLTSYSHIMTSERTFLYAALGGTLLVAALLQVLARKQPLFSAFLAVVFLLSGFGSQWHQLSHYTALSNRQRMILAGILEAAPNAGTPGSKRLLIIDRSGTTINTWMLRGLELGNALTLLYGQEVEPLVCIEPGMAFSSFQAEPSGKPGTCRQTPSGWIVGLGLPAPISIDNKDLRLLTIEPDGHVTSLEPPLSASAADQARWHKFLGCWPAEACAYRYVASETDRYDYGFGPFWGLDDVPWGAGFREIEWNLPSVNPKSWSWITSPNANLWFRIKPRPGKYTFQMNIYTWITEDARQSFRVRLNDRDIGMQWIEPRVLRADFDASILKPGLNQIELLSRTNPENGLSIAVDRVTIYPVSAP